MLNTISRDAFTLYEYMYNSAEKGLFSQPLLATCIKLRLKSHDHARARYTRELKDSKLAFHVHRKGWRINAEERADQVTVAGTDKTVFELLADPGDTPKPEPVTPSVQEVTAPKQSHDYTGAQLAQAVAEKLLEKLTELQQRVFELESATPRPNESLESDYEVLKKRHEEIVQEFEDYSSARSQEITTLNSRIEALQAELTRANQTLEAQRRTMAASMEEIAGSKSGEDIKASAQRFLLESAGQ